MPTCFLSLGSNVRPRENLSRAIRALGSRLVVTAISTVYLTEPIGMNNAAAFYNCVVKAESDSDPYFLKTSILRDLEGSLGRVRSTDRYSDRVIDIDLLLYGQMVIEELKVPDPDIFVRPYLASCICELDGSLIIPGSGVRICSIAKELGSTGMKPLLGFTKDMNREAGLL
ncbi:MAG: 2-amino-4-hydroxy-6-hydroxymethyldihydropteridine diphosphokinase [Nitrososphaerota archaeon]|nr:2-amino-4-hydroxy-6-hydroxymethyldihydropteridine diphosphokinase [Nitrososphaerota archaeon]